MVAKISFWLLERSRSITKASLSVMILKSALRFALSISDTEGLSEYFVDGLPSDDGAFGFLKPLLWAAAGDTSLNARFLLNWLLRLFVIQMTQT